MGMGGAQGLDDDIERIVDGGVAWITLNRPEAGNALTPEMNSRLAGYMDEASADLAVRAVVLTAAGTKSFCTGADLRSRRDPAPRPQGAPQRAAGDVARMLRIGWQRLITAVLDCEKPVVAAVNGTAAGGGMHLALACDLVLAADSGRVIEVFVRRGIVPDAGGAYLLPRLIGPQRAKELFFFGDDLSATDAERWGLVNRVVAAEDLVAVAGEWAGRLASGPTRTLAGIKWLANRSMESDRASALWEEALVQEMAQQSEDAREGMRSFAERRPPAYRGW